MRTNDHDLSVVRPRSVKEALALLAEAAAAGAPLTPMAGGTDLYVTLAAGTSAERRFIDLWGLDKLRGIEQRGVGRKAHLRLGALTTFTAIRRSKAVRRALPILAEAAAEVGGVQIQNRGTLGGNIANGSPAGDSLPVLLAAGAIVVLRSTAGEREVPLADYYTGYRRSVRRPDELITAVIIPAPRGRQVFRKVGTRAAQAISKVVLAAVGPRVAVGSVGPTPIVLAQLEAYLAAGGDDPTRARALAEADIAPIDDIRSTEAYRREIVGNLVEALLVG